MMKRIYLDCFSGVSGNMLLGALLDAGVPQKLLHDTLQQLNIKGFEVNIEHVQIHGFAACRVTVTTDEHHPHRHLADIKSILDDSALEPAITAKAKAVFHRLAKAEAAVHGTTVEAIHFHEVGAVDALVDIVGTVAGFHFLGPVEITCSPLPMPGGWVQCAHGEIPLPAPAVCKLLQDVPVYGESLQQELVTPTGAALVAELASGFGQMPAMILQKTAYGAGTMQRADSRPNLLRIQVGEALEVMESQQVDILDTHIDDWNPELWPHTSQLLLDAGALDVCLIPIQMKKGRPGFLVRVVSTPANTLQLKNCLFTETSTIGIRCRRESRSTLVREAVTVDTPWGPLQAKKIHRPGGIEISPEYEACLIVAKQHGIPLQTVYAAVRDCQLNSSSTDK
jgi:uncharacterized protein (TIGR00299 family) protein